jgi:transmembrane sensor
MKENKYIELIAQHLSGKISESDRRDFREWINSNAKNQALLEEMRQLWEISKEHDFSFDTNVKEAWKKVEQRIEVTNEAKGSSFKAIRLFSIKQYLKIAAVILFGSVSLFLFFQNQEPELFTFKTIEEQTLDFLLPDSSRIVMNKNSHLTYQNIEGKRIVTLAGEAWFDVKHLDSIPFEIESGETKTVVLGTTFNVRAYPQEDITEVSVERGKVAFFEKENEENKKILEAGIEGFFDKIEKTEIEIEVRENSNVDAWRTLTIDCDNVKLRKVFETMERYFEFEIEVADLTILDCHLFGSYENPEFDVLFKLMKEALGLKIEKKGNTYFVSGKGC